MRMTLSSGIQKSAGTVACAGSAGGEDLPGWSDPREANLRFHHDSFAIAYWPCLFPAEHHWPGRRST